MGFSRIILKNQMIKNHMCKEQLMSRFSEVVWRSKGSEQWESVSFEQPTVT